jgi:hypothetical protein
LAARSAGGSAFDALENTPARINLTPIMDYATGQAAQNAGPASASSSAFLPATGRAPTCRTFVAAPKTELAAAWREIPRDGVAVMAARLWMGFFWHILDALDTG